MGRAQPPETVDDEATTGVFVPVRESPGPPPRPETEMLTVREAAAVLRVNVKTVYLEIAAGRLRHVLLGRRIIRIPRSVIASLISKSA
jgi:excisionase family DNA binding protein